MKEIKELKDLNELDNGEGNLYLRASDQYVDVHDRDEKMIIATFYIEDFHLSEIVRVLKTIWDFDIEIQNQFSYFISYVAINKSGQIIKVGDGIMMTGGKIDHPDDLIPVRDWIRNLHKEDLEGLSIILKSISLL